MNFNIFDLFRGKGNWQTIISFIVIAIFGLIYIMSPVKSLKCVNHSCTLKHGDKVLATFYAGDITDCSFSKKPYESCHRDRRRSYSTSSREYVRERCRTEYKYLPKITLSNGKVLTSDMLYTFYSEASASSFCLSVKNAPNYEYESK